jgi:prephenate dehydrogenase
LIDTGQRAPRRDRGRSPARRRRACARSAGIPIAGNAGRASLRRAPTFLRTRRSPSCRSPSPSPADCQEDGPRALGAKALVVDPRTHDRALARTSHLLYLLSIAIEASGAKAARRGLAGPGFRGMTRMAKADPASRGLRAEQPEEVQRAWQALSAR